MSKTPRELEIEKVATTTWLDHAIIIVGTIGLLVFTALLGILCSGLVALTGAPA